MKKDLFPMLWVMLTMLSCKEGGNHAANQESLPGRYCLDTSHQPTRVHDTLLLTLLSAETMIGITRSTLIEMTGRPAVYKKIYWTAQYLPGERVLLVDNNGRKIFYDPAANTLRMGSTVYYKSFNQ